MATKKTSVKQVIAQTVKLSDKRSATERLEKVDLKDGSGSVYIWHPQNRSSKAVLRPYPGLCRETGEEFILYRSQVLEDGKWTDPVVDLHPELMAQRAAAAEAFRAEKDSIVSAYPAEVKAALGLKA